MHLLRILCMRYPRVTMLSCYALKGLLNDICRISNSLQFFLHGSADGQCHFKFPSQVWNCIMWARAVQLRRKALRTRIAQARYGLRNFRTQSKFTVPDGFSRRLFPAGHETTAPKFMKRTAHAWVGGVVPMNPTTVRWAIASLVPRPFLYGRGEKGEGSARREGRVWWITRPQCGSMEFH